MILQTALEIGTLVVGIVIASFVVVGLCVLLWGIAISAFRIWRLPKLLK